MLDVDYSTFSIIFCLVSSLLRIEAETNCKSTDKLCKFVLSKRHIRDKIVSSRNRKLTPKFMFG